MSKRRQGPINKRLDFISNKLNKYSIRKFTVGTASILVGATLIFGHADDEAKAAEENHMENTSLNSIENDNDKNNQKIDSSNETATTSTEEVRTKEAPSNEVKTEEATTKEAPSKNEVETEEITNTVSSNENLNLQGSEKSEDNKIKVLNSNYDLNSSLSSEELNLNSAPVFMSLYSMLASDSTNETSTINLPATTVKGRDNYDFYGNVDIQENPTDLDAKNLTILNQLEQLH